MKSFWVSENECSQLKDFLEYKFVEAIKFDAQSYLKTRRSLHHDSRSVEGGFLFMAFNQNNDRFEEKKIITVRDIKVGKSPKLLVPITSKNVKVNQNSKTEHRYEKVSKSPERKEQFANKQVQFKSKTPEKKEKIFVQTANISPVYSQSPNSYKMAKTDVDFKRRVDARFEEVLAPIDYRQVVDRLHPKLVKSKSPDKIGKNANKSKDYYIDHPDLYKEVIYKLEGKPKTEKTIRFYEPPKNEIRVVGIVKNQKYGS